MSQKPLALLNQIHVVFDDRYHLSAEQICIEPLQHTVFVGANGSGKSALAAAIAGQGELRSGEVNLNGTFEWVSVEQQKAIIDAERKKDSADILDVIPTPTSVDSLLRDGMGHWDAGLFAHLCDLFALEPLLSRPFRALSTGETKKVLLTKAMLAKPALLILDEPYDGLDKDTCLRLKALLEQLSITTTLLLVVNRLNEIPTCTLQVVGMQLGSVAWQHQMATDYQQELAQIRQLLHLQQGQLHLPAPDSDKFAPKPLDGMAPLVRMRKARVAYSDTVIFDDLNWEVLPGQHWQISGPNGSGKTCLLNLITGDHPQCYANDIFVFGFQRGHGESIWQIKQYIGYVSNGLHLEYRVNCSVLHVLLSGFYDSIGLYQQPTRVQLSLAKEWLEVIGLTGAEDIPFQRLSHGDQRLVLIARAMVKHPSILILDEPCNGLDEINRSKVLALVELLASQKITSILYVSHHQEDVLPCIDHQLQMADYRPA